MSAHWRSQLRGFPAEARFAAATAAAFIDAAARERGVEPAVILRRFGARALGSMARAAARRPDGEAMLRGLARDLVAEISPHAGIAPRPANFPRLPAHDLPTQTVALHAASLRRRHA